MKCKGESNDGVRSETANPEKGDQRCRNHRDRPLKNVPRKRLGRRNDSRKKLVACNLKNARQTLVWEAERKTPILPGSVPALNRCPRSGTQLPALMKRRNRPLPSFYLSIERTPHRGVLSGLFFVQ